MALRCNACGAIEVTMIQARTEFKTCAYRPCGKRFETTTDRYGANRRYCNVECRGKAYDLGRSKGRAMTTSAKSFLVEVWRPRQGEQSGLVAVKRIKDPDHSFFVSATDSDAARTEIAKSEFVKKGDTYRMSEVVNEAQNKSGGLVVTGKVK